MRCGTILMIALAVFAAGGVFGYMLRGDAATGGHSARTTVEQPEAPRSRPAAASLRAPRAALPIDRMR